MKGFASNARMIFLAMCILALFGVVPARFVWLHVIDRAQRVSQANDKRRQVYEEIARRGDIVDARGDTLATSRSLVQVAVDPNAYARYFRTLAKRPNKTLAEKDAAREIEKWRQLAELIGMPPDELNRICTTRKRTIATTTTPRATPVTPDDDDDDTPGSNPALDPDDPVTLASNETLIRFAWLCRAGVPEDIYRKITALNIRSGLSLNRVYERTYPHNQLAAHLLGFVNKEQIPVTGLEQTANCYLKGANGWRETEKDAIRRELVQFRSREVPASDGYTVKLTIDSVIQTWAEEELAAIAAKFNPAHAVIIISDAQTGALLALANHPTFNPNEYGKAPEASLANFAAQAYIDPGSTFKIVAASGALEDKLVTPDTPFDCTTPVVEYKGRKLALMADDHRWDHPLTVSEIISHSSNRGAALLAMRLGDQRFYDYIRAFGFGSRTGAFPERNEIYGAINPLHKWSAIDITRIAAGYSIGATPLQIHYAMATIAGGGELVVPQLISEVRTPEDELAFQFSKNVRRRVISPDTARTMRSLLQRVVSSDGTAGKIAIPGYQFAGKTGTAQKVIDGRYSKTHHVGSFSGFFPAATPRVVITVIVDDGKTPNGAAAYGATVAAPSFRHLAEKLIPYLNIKPVQETPLFLQPNTALAARQP